ncbi:MAG: tRNA (cytidine(34)-2'-O)-methyltransferase [Polyangiaceae bacterium]
MTVYESPDDGRLRRPAPSVPFQIALIEPEIPQNTGNVGRICVGTTSTLHLVGKLGFQIDEKAVRRAGLDYWHMVDLRRHEDINSFEQAVPPHKWKVFCSFATQSYLDARYEPGDVLVFGKESVGLPREFVKQHEERAYGIPMCGPIRSLNLANAVSVVLYEALRQTGAI